MEGKCNGKRRRGEGMKKGEGWEEGQGGDNG